MAELDPTGYVGIITGIAGPTIVYILTHLKIKKSEENNFGPSALKSLDEMRKEQQDLQKRVTESETKIEPFWNMIIKNAPQFLHSDDTPVFDALLKKIENHTATYQELIQFRQLLEQKIQEMVKNKERDRFVFAAAYLVNVDNLIRSMKK